MRNKSESGAAGAASRWSVRGRGFEVLAWCIALLVVALVLVPLVRTWISVFTTGGGAGAAISSALQERNLGRVLLDTVWVVGGSVAVAGIFGSAFAWLSERTDASLGWLSRALPIIPMMVPPIAGAAGWITLGSPNAGYINVVARAVLSWFGLDLDEGPISIFSWYGLVAVYAIYLIPLVFIQVAAGLRNLDASLEEAARSNGAGPLRTLRTVTLPAVKPALAAGIILAIVYAFALFSIPMALGYPAGIEVLTVRIVRLMRGYPAEIETALTLGIIVVVIISASLYMQNRLMRNMRFATIGGRGAKASRVSMGIWKWPLRALMVGYFLVTAVIPLAGLVAVSIQPFWAASIDWGSVTLSRYGDLFTGTDPARSALQNSLLLATVGATVTVLIAAVLASHTARSAGIGARITDASVKVPGAVSNIIIGIAFVGALAAPPIGLSGTLLILLLAYMVITLPQASFSASAAYAQVGRDLEEASLTAGATYLRTFRKVTIPLMLPGLTAGWSMVFVLMAGDLTASAMLSGPSNPVVGSYMLDQMNFGSYGSLSAIAVVLILVSCAVILGFTALSERVGRRGLV